MDFPMIKEVIILTHYLYQCKKGHYGPNRIVKCCVSRLVQDKFYREHRFKEV